MGVSLRAVFVLLRNLRGFLNFYNRFEGIILGGVFFQFQIFFVLSLIFYGGDLAYCVFFKSRLRGFVVSVWAINLFYERIKGLKSFKNDHKDIKAIFVLTIS